MVRNAILKHHKPYLGLFRRLSVGVTVCHCVPMTVGGLLHIGHPLQKFGDFITMLSLLLIYRSLKLKQMGFLKKNFDFMAKNTSSREGKKIWQRRKILEGTF